METNAVHINVVKKEFPRRLKMLRKKKNIDRMILSELCGRNRNAVKLYEEGKCIPKLDTAVELADALGVSLDYLAGRTDDPKTQKIFKNFS